VNPSIQEKIEDAKRKSVELQNQQVELEGDLQEEREAAVATT
jgi:hypothetical protein